MKGQFEWPINSADRALRVCCIEPHDMPEMSRVLCLVQVLCCANRLHTNFFDEANFCRLPHSDCSAILAKLVDWVRAASAQPLSTCVFVVTAEVGIASCGVWNFLWRAAADNSVVLTIVFITSSGVQLNLCIIMQLSSMLSSQLRSQYFLIASTLAKSLTHTQSIVSVPSVAQQLSMHTFYILHVRASCLGVFCGCCWCMTNTGLTGFHYTVPIGRVSIPALFNARKFNLHRIKIVMDFCPNGSGIDIAQWKWWW